MHKLYWIPLTLFVAAGCLTLSGCGRPATASLVPQKEAAKALREKLAAGGSESTGEAAAESTGTGWGTLKGSFKFAGTPPTPGKLNVDKDTEVCGKGMGLTDNSLVVGSDQGIANVVIYARVKRVHDSAQPLPAENEAQPIVFDQKECMFLTHVLACQVNQQLAIKNSDPIGHNTKIDPKKGSAFNQNLPKDETVKYVTTDEEAFPASVACSIHPWMKAYLLPRKDKYFAVTKPDGTFEIPNLPAGEEVELQVWHERGAGPSGGVPLDRKDLKWSKQGRFKIKLEADKTTDLALEVPASSFK